MGDVHRDLVLRACRWLEKTERCTRVFAEVQTLNLSEFPDAIGYNTRGETVVVEAKASVSDFKRDASKEWKRRAKAWESAPPGEASSSQPIGMGAWRYYIMPREMVPLDAIPECHGVLWVSDKGKVFRMRKAPHRPLRDVNSEISILCTMLQRYELDLRWLPKEYRFETERENKARVTQELTAMGVDVPALTVRIQERCDAALDAVEVIGRAIGGADA